MTIRDHVLALPTVVLIVALVVAGCATLNEQGTAPGATNADVYDPFEKFNRAVYKFNDTFDQYLLRPTAGFYERTVPAPIKTGVNNFFRNAFEPTTIINDVLQGKIKQAVFDTGRFLVNTTIGVLGLFDVATHMGLLRHNEDFGQTFAVWGLREGPYLVLPFLGPSNVRDGIGLIPYYYGTYPLSHVEDREARLGFVAVDVLNERVNLLNATRIMEGAGLDPYVFVREAFRQRRKSLIYDGNPPLDYLLEE